jgi:hypothetical protein
VEFESIKFGVVGKPLLSNLDFNKVYFVIFRAIEGFGRH